MAKLPQLEIVVSWAWDELHRGNRKKALELLAKAGDGPGARELRELVKKRGRQPFGAKHLWWDIGVENDLMRSQGVSYAERLERLALQFRYNDISKLKTAINAYEVAREEIRSLDFD